MKKTVFKILKITAILMIVASVSLLSLSGCTFIRENPERVATQTLVTITNPVNQITLTITQTELFDYFNNFIQQHAMQQGLSMREALDLAFEMQTKSKYFLTVGAHELMTNTSFGAPGSPFFGRFDNRTTVLRGQGGFTAANGTIVPTAQGLNGTMALADALTHAEFYSTIFAVNESFRRTISDFAEEARQLEYSRIINRIDRTNIAKIDFAPSTLEHLKAEYFVGEQIDTDQIRFVIYRFIDADDRDMNKIVVDHDEKDSDGNPIPLEFRVTDGMFSTRFSTESAGEDRIVEIRFDERYINEDGETAHREHLAYHEFNVVAPRAHWNRPADPTRGFVDNSSDIVGRPANGIVERRDIIQFGDIQVWRYAAAEQVRNAIGEDTEVMNLQKEWDRLNALPNATPEQIRERDAVKRVMDNLARGFRSEQTIHNSAIESMITTVLQAEWRKLASVSDADVIAEFKHMFERAGNSFIGMTEEQVQRAFFDLIRSDLGNFFFHPPVTEDGEDILQGFFYVYQILINFGSEFSDHVRENTSVNMGEANRVERRNQLWNWGVANEMITTRRSNFNFDPSFECPHCQMNEVGSTCIWVEKDEDGEYVNDFDTDRFANRYGFRTEFNCPSRPFIENRDADGFILDDNNNRLFMLDNLGNPVVDGDGEVVYLKDITFNWVIQNLGMQMEDAIANDNDPMEVFRRFMYEFNDDPGIMNSTLGYLMGPESIDDMTGFWGYFSTLAYDVFNHGNETGGALHNIFVGDISESDSYGFMLPSGQQVGYAFTDHGIHIIMVSFVPFADQTMFPSTNPPSALSFENDAAIRAFLERQINLNNEDDTLWVTLRNALLSSREERLYAEFMEEAIPQDTHLGTESAIIVENRGPINRIYRMLNA